MRLSWSLPRKIAGLLHRMQGMGIGTGLLADVLTRTVGLTDSVGIRALLVHAREPVAAAAGMYKRSSGARSCLVVNGVCLVTRR